MPGVRTGCGKLLESLWGKAAPSLLCPFSGDLIIFSNSQDGILYPLFPHLLLSLLLSALISFHLPPITFPLKRVSFGYRCTLRKAVTGSFKWNSKLWVVQILLQIFFFRNCVQGSFPTWKPKIRETHLTCHVTGYVCRFSGTRFDVHLERWAFAAVLAMVLTVYWKQLG